MKKTSIFVIVIFSLFVCYPQEQNPFYIGHSLVNHDMPAMVQGLAENAGKTTYHGKHIINGAPLQYNYNNASSAEGTPYTNAFPNGNYNTLVITEAIPLQNHLMYSDTYQFANNFYNYANNNNNGVPLKFYIYETWHCINSGIPSANLPSGCDNDNSANSNILWHPRLQTDFSLWTGIVDHIRNQNPTDNQIWMIPAGQAFYELTVQINAGNVPGISSVTDLFNDDIHLTNAGNYFIACVMYATIYRESPIGLTTNLNNQWDTPFINMPTMIQAMEMQQVAWNVVNNLNSWTGVSMPLSANNNNLQSFSVHPNPAKDNITINTKDFNETVEIEIYNSLGVLVKRALICNNKTLDVSNLTSGLYFIQFNIESSPRLKFIKN